MSRAGKLSATALRSLTAAAVIPAVLLLVWIPVLSPVFVIVLAGLAAVGLREYFGMVKALDIAAEPRCVIATGTGLVLWAGWAPAHTLSPALIAAILIVAAGHLFAGKHTLAGLASSVFGLVYVAFFAAHFALLHAVPEKGPVLVTVLLAVVIFSDSGAYFTGRALGKHKLAPVVSPNKTWEGAAGGLILAGAAMAVCSIVFTRMHENAFPSASRVILHVIIGVLIAAAGQIGDLVESMLKRNAGIKDSGALFPGHGGVLDRCDGFLFAAPVFYYLCCIQGP